MKNKVNVSLIVPGIGESYNVFIPVNKTIGEIITILNSTINKLNGFYPISNSLSLLNVKKGIIYNYEVELINTDIKNGTLLALI